MFSFYASLKISENFIFFDGRDKNGALVCNELRAVSSQLAFACSKLAIETVE